MLSGPAFGDVNIDGTNFPDPNFRNYVSTQFDENSDGMLSDAEIAQVKQVNVANSGIANLIGIEYLTALERLECSGNSLKAIDFPNPLPHPKDSSRSIFFRGIVSLFLFQNFKSLGCDFRVRKIPTGSDFMFSMLDFVGLYGLVGDEFDTSYALMVWYDTSGRRGLVTPFIGYVRDTLTGQPKAPDIVRFSANGTPTMLESRTVGEKNIQVNMYPEIL